MSMSTYVRLVRAPDEKFQKMRTIYETCKSAGVDIPDEVERFFEWERPQDLGVIFDPPGEAVTQSSDGSREFFDVDVSKLPDGVTHVRFVNSW